MKAKALLLALALGSLAVPVFAAEPALINPKDIKWGPAPPSLPKGSSVVVLHGDPAKEGSYAIRARMPAGYVIPPHFHSRNENLTVLSGALYLGLGDTLDKKAARALKAGGFLHVPGKTHHFAFTKAETVLQIQADGPFDITYLNPADDPSTK